MRSRRASSSSTATPLALSSAAGEVLKRVVVRADDDARLGGISEEHAHVAVRLACDVVRLINPARSPGRAVLG